MPGQGWGQRQRSQRGDQPRDRGAYFVGKTGQRGVDLGRKGGICQGVGRVGPKRSHDTPVRHGNVVLLTFVLVTLSRSRFSHRSAAASLSAASRGEAIFIGE